MINCCRAVTILLGRVKKRCALLSRFLLNQLVIFSFQTKMFMWVFLNTLSLQIAHEDNFYLEVVLAVLLKTWAQPQSLLKHRAFFPWETSFFFPPLV